MNESVYIWEVNIPAKIEYKLYQACVLVGIDINDELKVWFSDYGIHAGASYSGYYASVIITATDKEMNDIYHKLVELEAWSTDMWILDELCEEIEEENESWQNQ